MDRSSIVRPVATTGSKHFGSISEAQKRLEDWPATPPKWWARLPLSGSPAAVSKALTKSSRYGRIPGL
jgi:hypothetical protein